MPELRAMRIVRIKMGNSMKSWLATVAAAGVVAGAALGSTMLDSTALRAQTAPVAPKAAGTAAWDAKVAADKADTTGVALDETQTGIIKRVSGYFNELNGLKGVFVQTGADKKRMKGKFFVKRPGRFRFDYALPSKQIIISDGQYLAIQDLDLNNEDRVALDQTPFRLLLRKDVDLLRDARIIEAQEADDLVIVALQDKDPEAPGKIKLFMSTKPTLELKEWVTTDAQGLDTRLEVSELAKADDLDANLFKIQPVGLNKMQQQ
ncbi:MAG: outer-membrane lipoprotein carrier protein LolA [Hyphomicrobium sp.]